MTDYKEPYYLLFNAITDALEALGQLDIPAANHLLEDAQSRSEEIVLEHG